MLSGKMVREPNMHRLVRLIVVGLSVLLTSSHAVSQDIEIEDLQRNIDIFSNILEDVLELDQGTGLFGLTLAGIDNNYLLGQGVVFEIRTPLANRRNRINLASLNSAMQSLQIRTNSFVNTRTCLLYTSPSPRDYAASRMPSSA